jgi:hypothetical protein
VLKGMLPVWQYACMFVACYANCASIHHQLQSGQYAYPPAYSITCCYQAQYSKHHARYVHMHAHVCVPRTSYCELFTPAGQLALTMRFTSATGPVMSALPVDARYKLRCIY